MLQAISYAGMVSRWSPDDFCQILSEQEWEDLVDFLQVDIEDINRTQRLLLVAEGYDYALLSGAEWLSENYGVDVRCVSLSLATDPENGTEYLACGSVFPPPALAEQAVARNRLKRGSRPLKWADWKDALVNVANDSLRQFVEKELGQGRESNLRKRELFYRQNEKRRWVLCCRKEYAYVWQKGRFSDDLTFWKKLLGKSALVNEVKQGQALSFKLHTKEQLEAFFGVAAKAPALMIWHQQNGT
jgi:hypothetical protein